MPALNNKSVRPENLSAKVNVDELSKLSREISAAVIFDQIRGNNANFGTDGTGPI